MSEKVRLEVPGASLPFYSYELEGINYIEFDASESELPEPMVNAMKGFALISGTDKRLVMINAHEPTPLYLRIADSFVWDVEVLENGNIKIVFSNKM
ncbi:MAG: hypothetical protein WBF77_05975 [Sulfurimonadaceae bacterium]